MNRDVLIRKIEAARNEEQKHLANANFQAGVATALEELLNQHEADLRNNDGDEANRADADSVPSRRPE